MSDGITLGKPIVGEPEIKEIADVFDTGWVLNGPTTREFESRFADLVDVEHAVAVTNCTIGMDMALEAADLDEGSRVLLPAQGFIANLISVYRNGLAAVFADVDDRTYTMTSKEIQPHAEDVDAILPLHYAGLPCNMEAITTLADEYDLFVLEDAAHALGASHQGDPIGSHGDAVVFSFGPLKMITTGMGGMITTDDDDLAERLRTIRSYGMDQDAYSRDDDPRSWRYEISTLGHNYRLSDVAAGMGLAQLDRLDSFIEGRSHAAYRYTAQLAKVGGIDTPVEVGHSQRVFLYYVIRVRSDYPLSRDALAERLMEQNIGCSVHWDPPLTSHLADDRPNQRKETADFLSDQLLTLPLHPKLRDDEVDRVVDVIREPL